MLLSSPHADYHNIVRTISSECLRIVAQIKEYLANPEAFAVAAPAAAEEAAPAAAAVEEEKKEEEEDEDEDMVRSLNSRLSHGRSRLFAGLRSLRLSVCILMSYLRVSIRILALSRPESTLRDRHPHSEQVLVVATSEASC